MRNCRYYREILCRSMNTEVAEAPGLDEDLG